MSTNHTSLQNEIDISGAPTKMYIKVKNQLTLRKIPIIPVEREIKLITNLPS